MCIPRSVLLFSAKIVEIDVASEYTNHIWLEGFIEIIARVFPLTPDCKEGVNEDECNNFDKAHHKCD